MTKNYILLLLFVAAKFLAQESPERKMMIQRESSQYAKLAGFNQNPNTLNYDLKYQRMDLDLDPAVYRVAGSVTSHFLTNQSLSTIYMDFTNVIPVSEVLYHGTPLTFQQLATSELKIDFPAALPANTLDSLTVKYAGAPPTDRKAFSTSTQNGTPVLYTLSEPYGAMDWFPTKQSLNDKIDKFDFKITTPSKYSVASNGKLMSETILPTGKKLTFWRTQYPMAAYLAALAITNFTKSNDTMGNPPFPFINYLYPTTSGNSSVMASINWTKQAMQVFEDHFGPYPFRNEKYGHMEFSYSGVCMEHQSMSSMSSWGQSTIAHELAHQWFGDKITCGAWNDIWLNEGFATFGEHLVNEKLLMSPSQFMNYLQSQKNYITSQPGGTLYVANSNLGNDGAIFSGRLSYAKGGYVLRMIKWILGDAAFYAAVKDYSSRPELAYKYAKSPDLKNSLEQSTGKDFTEFFMDWLYGEGYPTYNITWNQEAAGTPVVYNVKQTQSVPSSVNFFEMPLPIKVTGTNGEVAYMVLENNANDQYFTKPVGFQVASVTFNYEYQILERNSTVSKNSALVLASQDAASSKPMKVYPVPAQDYLSISGIPSNSGYEIYSVDGRLLKKGSSNADEKISVREFVPGVYFIKIEGKSFKFTKK